VKEVEKSKEMALDARIRENLIHALKEVGTIRANQNLAGKVVEKSKEMAPGKTGSSWMLGMESQGPKCFLAIEGHPPSLQAARTL
jgi:hypothetical protein